MFDPTTPVQVLTFDLPRVLFADAVSFGFQVTFVCTPIIGVLPICAHRFQQGFGFLEHLVPALTQYIGQYRVGVMIHRISKANVGWTGYLHRTTAH